MSAQSRLTTWKIAVQMANERIVLRVRNSNLEPVHISVWGRTSKVDRSIASTLQTAADSGWVGLGLYLSVLLSTFLGLWSVRQFLRKYRDPETMAVKSMAAGLECALFLFCAGAVFLSLEHFEMPYILILLSIQLHAITCMVAARYGSPASQPGPVVATQAIPNPSASVGR